MKFLLLPFLIFLVLSASAQDCSKFKTGTFEYETHGLGTLITERTATHEYVYTANKVFQIRSSIEWLSSCKYILTCEKITNPDLDLQDLVGTKEIVEIIETDEDGYTYRTTDKDGDIQTVSVSIRKE